MSMIWVGWPPGAAASIVMLWLIVGRALAGLITCTPLPILNLMVSLLPALVSASRREPMPVSLVLVTVNMAGVSRTSSLSKYGRKKRERGLICRRRAIDFLFVFLLHHLRIMMPLLGKKKSIKIMSRQAQPGWHALSLRRACLISMGCHALRRLRACHPSHSFIT